MSENLDDLNGLFDAIMQEIGARERAALLDELLPYLAGLRTMALGAYHELPKDLPATVAVWALYKHLWEIHSWLERRHGEIARPAPAAVEEPVPVSPVDECGTVH
jgi:hypothetical protein